MIAYYVKNSSGDQFGNSNWPGPTIAPNMHESIDILSDGKAFTFQAGSTYAIIMITSRGYQFTFTIIVSRLLSSTRSAGYPGWLPSFPSFKHSVSDR